VRFLALFAVVLYLGPVLLAQQARVREADPIHMPAQVDSNSPGFWSDGQLHLFNSTGDGPILSSGPGQFQLGMGQPVSLQRINPWPTWIEAVWQDPSGALLGWYHREQFDVCSGKRLSVPQIGAAISYDGGYSFRDLGIILSSGAATNCSAQNGYFAGGHGDVSVILDRAGEYFYFLFGNYAGPLETQGVVVARMPFASRFQPVGSVNKYYAGGWTEPGLRGRTTPIFPAVVGWSEAATDSYWGPAVHWNTYLESYVVLLNRSCCGPGFPQAGIYISYSTDLSDPLSWRSPALVLEDTGWYPQVLGLETGETDSLAGRVARLYTYGHSRWEIVFARAGETFPEEPAQPEQPATPETPTEPETPSTPETPDPGEEPPAPEEPPEQPDPEQPPTPEQPDPEQPDTPDEQPSTPEQPDPEQPDTPEEQPSTPEGPPNPEP